MTFVSKIEVLRLEALREVWNLPALATVKALDEAVVAAGGESLLVTAKRADKAGTRSESPVVRSALKEAHASIRAAKVSQGDAAELALRELGPLPVGRLMEAAVTRGASIGGEKPLTSFRSMLSKDDRFVSIMRNNMYFWWLSNAELPVEFEQDTSTRIDDLLGIGSSASERGGDHDGSSTI